MHTSPQAVVNNNAVEGANDNSPRPALLSYEMRAVAHAVVIAQQLYQCQRGHINQAHRFPSEQRS